MNSEKAICLKPGALIRMSLIVLHTNYTNLLPQTGNKRTTKSSNPGEVPLKRMFSSLFTVYSL